jgi:hypothetical protein
MASEKLLVELVAKVDDATKKVEGVGSKIGGIGKVAAGVGGAIAGAFAVGAIVDFGKAAVDSYSTLEQSIGGVEAVFGDAAETVTGFGDAAAESVGLAASEYNTLSTQLGGLLKNSGIYQDTQDLAGATNELVTIGADLAATYGGSTAEAVAALGSAFRGEADPAEKYALNLKASAVNAKAMELGLVDAEGKVTEAGKAQAIMALITEQSSDAMGQFGREAETTAGKQARLTAKWENAQATIGAKLVPVVLKLFDAFEPLIPVILLIVDALAPLIEIVGELIAPIAKLAATVIPAILKALQPFIAAVRLVAQLIGWLVTQIQKLVNWLGRVKVPDWIGKLSSGIGRLGNSIFGGGRSAARVASVSAGTGTSVLAGSRAAASTLSVPSGSRGGVQLVIQAGVGDPVEIGRKVVEYLAAYERAGGSTWRRTTPTGFAV